MIKKIITTGNETIFTKTLEDIEFTLKENSHLTFVALLKEDHPEAKNLHFNLIGENSNITFIALIIAKKSNKFNFETTATHPASQTKSAFYLRTILFDQSEVDYKGTLKIKPIAQNSESYLSHHTLTFSPDAKVQTIPSLEIETDAVKAGHSASIGKIDQEQLLYMSSRGIDQNTSAKLLTESFLKLDLDKISDQKIKQIVIDELKKLK